MPIPTSILQSMLAFNAAEIDKNAILLQSYKDLRAFSRDTHAFAQAEKMNKLVEKTRGKIGKLARNQKAIKMAIEENLYNDYVDSLLENYEEY